MSETTGGGIAVTPEVLRAKVEEIAQIDEQLDAASGSESAGKRALGNALAKEHEPVWKATGDSLAEEFGKISDPAQLAGVYNGILQVMHDNFRTQVDEYLAEEVSKRDENKVEVAPEQIQEWTETRKTLMNQYKALHGILEMFEQDISGIPEPRKRTGARGKRGKRIFQGFDWFVDDEPRSESQNTLSSIANTITDKALGWKTPELRNFLTEQGIDLNNPPAEGSVMLPDPVNKKISWKQKPISLEGSEEEDFDEEEDEDDELE